MNLRDQNYLRSLVLEFAAMPSETGWLEFKENKAEPQDIGEYISALANSAALEGRAHAYMLWGVADEGHAIRHIVSPGRSSGSKPIDVDPAVQS